MKILLNLDKTEIFNEIEINDNDNVETLKYLIEATFEIPFNQIEMIDGLSNNILKLQNHQVVREFINPDSLIIVKKKNQIMDILDSTIFKKTNNNSNNKVNINNNNNNSYYNNNSYNNSNNNNNNKINLGDVFDNTMKMLNNNKDSYLRDYAANEAKTIYNRFLNNPNELSILFNSDEKLAEAISSESIKAVEEVLFQRLKSNKEKQEEEKREYERLLKGDPNDPEIQKKIEKYIHKEKIKENRQIAMEYFPESFYSHHHMLYIPLEINNYKVIALVDTGAQMTIMSVDIAHNCGLYNLIDTDYQGQAVGVGTSKIIGVIHCAQIKIQDKFIMAKISVIENISIGFILGLDNMRSHRCSIELSTNSLIFKDAGININFLSDGECKKLKEKNEEENNDLIKKQSQDNLK